MRTTFLDIAFDTLTTDEVLARLDAAGGDAPFGYIVTPNVDHVVKLESPRVPGLREIVAGARLCLCDSRVLARLARLRGVRLTVVPGSDLTAGLFDRVIRRGDRLAIVGGDAAMVDRLRARCPGVEFVHHEPPFGLLTKPDAVQRAADFIVGQRARFAFLAVGFPQQELIAARAALDPRARGTALCIGASLEFLTSHQQRAPRAVQRLGLEWAFRLSREPRRLWRRYLVEGPAIFRIAWQWRR